MARRRVRRLRLRRRTCRMFSLNLKKRAVSRKTVRTVVIVRDAITETVRETT